MKVHKNLLGTNNDKIHVDEIAVAIDLLLGEAVIIEHGDNSNGAYVKFGDGTVISYGQYILDRDISGNEWIITFPFEFAVRAPGISIFPATGIFNNMMDMSRRLVGGVSTEQIRLLRPSNENFFGSGILHLNWIAVGRWK